VTRQRGVAVITALLIVAIAASAAALMLSQQSAMLDQTAMVSSRAQADAYAQAGLDWARGVLQQDGRTSPAQDSLDEGWAQPIPALPVERAVVSGRIVDEQGKFNLNNLVLGRTPADDLIFRTLLGQLGLSTDLLFPVVDWLDSNQDPENGNSAENSYYLSLPRPYRAADMPMQQVEELYRVRGFDAAAVAKLRPYVTALPVHTAINVNTASDVVLGALLNASPSQLTPVLAERARSAFKTGEAFADFADKKLGTSTPRTAVDVASSHFTVRIQVAQDDVQLALDALLQRQAIDKSTVILWRRPRY
jgi:general secretion pathway protein K